MNTEAVNQEYQTVNLSQLTESLTNPRKTFDHKTLNEMADFVPSHKIGIMFRWPFCGLGGDEPHG
jgi:hypothetical protein